MNIHGTTYLIGFNLQDAFNTARVCKFERTGKFEFKDQNGGRVKILIDPVRQLWGVDYGSKVALTEGAEKRADFKEFSKTTLRRFLVVYSLEPPKPVFAVELEGRIEILGRVRCSRIECGEMGCSFPDCARLAGESFDSLALAKTKYPNLQIV